MSKASLTIAVIALLLGAGALVAQFALPTDSQQSTISTDDLADRVAQLESQPRTAPSMNIAYLQAEEAFKVFTDAVENLREKAATKQAEIAQLQQQRVANTISEQEYQSQSYQLQVELLKAQLAIDMGTIERMISSNSFTSMHSDLQKLRDESQPILDEMNNLVETVRIGVVNPQEFEARLSQVRQAFNQLDQLLTQAATAKIVEVASNVAAENGYDLVLRTKNVIIYRNASKLVDITEMVKTELAGSL